MEICLKMDRKYEIYLIAEKIAREEYQSDFYDLTEKEQYEVFSRAEVKFEEELMDKADSLRKELNIKKGIIWVKR
uniref:Uncharacterized protein n=1 Tax=viral metagenome TaxID=1070528 RepID=A0A6M3XI73_9ZZZZ